MRHDVVQRAVVLLHMSEAFARKVFAPVRDGTAGTVRGLDDDEVALLRKTDPRAFRTDPERPLRLLAALLEEFPVSCAILGVGRMNEFIASSVFENAILRDRLVPDAFGDWLLGRAASVSLLELAVALARRRRRRRGVPGTIARAPGVEVARLPAGMLAFYASALARLRASDANGQAHAAVARGARLEGIAEPDGGPLEHVLIDAAGGVSTCAEPLFALLSFARDGKERAVLVAEAARLGADDDADDVVAECVSDGLLAPV